MEMARGALGQVTRAGHGFDAAIGSNPVDTQDLRSTRCS
jgi:hypothetical protein